jgi:SAM-dependent methyltransferase
METISCNLCGERRYRPVYRKPDALYHQDEWFTVVECRRCGLGFVNPRPTFEQMARYYPAQYYDYFREHAEETDRRYRKEAHIVCRHAPRRLSRRLLDVGCADGGFPRLMRGLGWEVEGVEVGENVGQIAEFPVYRQELTRIPFGDVRYDAVTAWGVLEHVHDPMAHFLKVGEILAQDGIFVFLVTNFESLASRGLFQEDVPRHLFFFSPRTVRAYLDAAGLECIHLVTTDEVYALPPSHWLQHLLYRHVLGRDLRWEDLYPRRAEYLAERGLNKNVWNSLRFLRSCPVQVLDTALLRLVAKWEMCADRYGVIVCAATRARAPVRRTERPAALSTR